MAEEEQESFATFRVRMVKDLKELDQEHNVSRDYLINLLDEYEERSTGDLGPAKSIYTIAGEVGGFLGVLATGFGDLQACAMVYVAMQKAFLDNSGMTEADEVEPSPDLDPTNPQTQTQH